VSVQVRTTAAAVVAALGIMLAGCTSEAPGTASPAPTTAGSSSAPADPNVPKVPAPLDVSKYVGDPCSIVPAAALSALRFTDAGKSQAFEGGQGAGPNCGWQIRGDGQSMQVIIATVNRDQGTGGLAGLYAAHQSGQLLKFLEPAPDVEGYPAIYIDTRDRRPAGNCSLDVGVADDLAIAVNSGGYQGQQDSCDAVQQVAAAVIKTLKGA
jgi:hypothetical protein